MLGGIAGEHVIAILGRHVAGIAGLVLGLIRAVAIVIELGVAQPPVAAYFFESLTMIWRYQAAGAPATKD